MADEANEIQHSKVVISREMIEAGEWVVRDYRDIADAGELASRVYTAMLAAQRSCHGRSSGNLGIGMSDDPSEETYSPEETEKRAAAALKRMLQTPHKPHKESKVGRKSRT